MWDRFVDFANHPINMFFGFLMTLIVVAATERLWLKVLGGVMCVYLFYVRGIEDENS